MTGGSGRSHLEKLAAAEQGSPAGRPGYRGRGCQRGRAACRSAAAPGDAGVGDHPAARRRLLPAPETGLDLKSGLFPGETVVLTHGEETDAAPAAKGGTGKTQLAVAFTQALRNARAVDVAGLGHRRAAGTRSSPASRRRPAVGAGDPDADAPSRRGPLHRLAGAHQAALGADPRRPGRPGRPGRACGPPGRTARSSSPPGCPPRPSASARTRRPAGRGSPRSAGSAAARCWPTSAPGSPTSPTSGPRRSTSARTWTGCRSALAQAAAVMSVNRLSCREYRARLGERREHMSGRSGSTASPRRAGHLVAGRRVRAPSCRPRAWPGRPWRWPPCSTRTASPARC